MDKSSAIYIGMATCGLASGARKIHDEVVRLVAEKGYPVTVHPTGCVGMCHNEPLLEIQMEGRARVTYRQVTVESVESILKAHFVDQTIFPDLAFGQSVEEGARPYEGVSAFNDTDYFRKQNKIVSRRCGVIDPSSIEDYLATNGYKALETVLKTMTPEQVVEVVTRSGLRGRGGAGFPTGLKWKFTYQSQGDEKYVVCNADERDPGAFMDRSVLEGDPHSVLEGMTIAAFAIGHAQKGYHLLPGRIP
ncbi:MAG: hypothetical protein D084_Lepto4C00093G0001, partial [Leptospirillum sp. Group IV 'UBA BS']